MSVVANRSGSTGTVTWSGNIADILTLTGVSNDAKRSLALQRAAAEIAAAAMIAGAGQTSADLDAAAALAKAAVDADVAAKKAAIPTGNF